MVTDTEWGVVNMLWVSFSCCIRLRSIKSYVTECYCSFCEPREIPPGFRQRRMNVLSCTSFSKFCELHRSQVTVEIEYFFFDFFDEDEIVYSAQD